MSAGPLTVARDVSLVITLPAFQFLLSPDYIEDFEAKPDAKVDKFLGVSGIITPYMVFEGGMFDMTIARTDAQVEQYWSLLEAEWYAGTNIPGGTIHETITEVNGSVSQNIYTNVQLKVDTFGMRKGNELIRQKLSGYFSRFERLT